MGRFRDYAPYNNMLVRIQNPACGFYATANDWQKRFGRTLIEDARPMLILAPMHPVMLVYDLDQTEGSQLPAELENFSRFPRRMGARLDSPSRRKRLPSQDSDRIQAAFVHPVRLRHAGKWIGRQDENCRQRWAARTKPVRCPVP